MPVSLYHYQMKRLFMKVPGVPRSARILPPPLKRWALRRGDLVQVNAGRDKGKQGVIKSIDYDKQRVIVEGAQLVKKHRRASEEVKGGVFLMEAPIAYSNVQLVDPVSKLPVRIRRGFLEDGSRVRVSKRSGAVIPFPPPRVPKPRTPFNPVTDTPIEVVLKRTYVEPV